MKKTLLLILIAVMTCTFTASSAQVNNLRQTSTDLKAQYESGQISQSTYVDLLNSYIQSYKEVQVTIIEKPHYSATLDLALIGGGVLYQKFGKNVKYDYILHVGEAISQQRR